ncbi:hypothetical protein [Jeotgalibacillus marinus]|uniref:Uncharacterized protein n=1 Tax=Jeotgalibacillus marinus TaxID=86667 RepID=A0ABV3Q7R9_9BACL
MIKNKLKGGIVLGSLLSIVGFILLFFSVNFGISISEYWLSKRGSVETSIYLKVIEGHTNNFLAAGSILFGVGVITLVLTYYMMLNIKE